MSNEEFQSYPGRTEMLELIRQRENQGAVQGHLGANADAYPLCLPPDQATPWPVCIGNRSIES
jgi:hypothetical protein